MKRKLFIHRGGFVNTEYMIIFAIILILVAIAIPRILNTSGWRKGIRCVENMIEIVEGENDSILKCPVSKLPYPPKKTGIVSCPDPKTHLHTHPRFVLEDTLWVFKQDLPELAANKAQPVVISTRGLFSTMTLKIVGKSVVLERKIRTWFRYVLRLMVVLGILGLGVWRTAVSENMGCFIVVLVSVLTLLYVKSHDKIITIPKGTHQIETQNRYLGKTLKPKVISNIRALYPLKRQRGSYTVMLFYFEDGEIENKKLFKIKRGDLAMLSPMHEAIFPP